MRTIINNGGGIHMKKTNKTNSPCTQCLDTQCHYVFEADPFLEWLVGILGPVMLGAKPAEILSFNHCEIDQQEKLKKIDLYFAQCFKMKMRRIPYPCGTVRILFYHPMSLEKALSDRRNLKFLKTMDYPDVYALEDYLDVLIEKMSDCKIPHEIGVFLGYPLKDVIGFMGDTRLKHAKTRGWRVYGDPRVSDAKFEEIQEAKCEIKTLLLTNHPLEIILN